MNQGLLLMKNWKKIKNKVFKIGTGDGAATELIIVGGDHGNYNEMNLR